MLQPSGLALLGSGAVTAELEDKMTRTMLSGLAVLGLLACGDGRQIPGGKTAGRGFDLVPIGAAGSLNDRLVNTGPSTHTLAAGAIIDAITDRTIASRSTTPGETLTARVDPGTKDQSGRVVLPTGSTVELTVTDITPATNQSQAGGTLTLEVTGVTVRGRWYPIAAEVTSVSHALRGRGIAAGEVDKVGIGTAIGVVAGRVIGGDARGTIIGVAAGAPGGTPVPVESLSRDVVVRAGTAVAITLTAPLTVASR